jgi:predicted alpha/beta hydrolase
VPQSPTAHPVPSPAGSLGGRLTRAADDGPGRGTTIVLLGALAAPQRYLRHTAAWLGRAGYDVLSVDYRGVGESAALGHPATNLDDWAEDARAALLAARELTAPRRLVVVGHSIGGMLVGHGGLGELVDGALLLASTHAAPQHYRGRGWLRLQAAYGFLPRIARLAGGHLPASSILLGASAPRDALVHWKRWGRSGQFASWDGRSTEGNFGRLRGPVVSVVVADDGYAPLPAVEALLARFSEASSRRLEVLRSPDQLPLGHFGVFRSDPPEWLQAWLLERLQGLTAEAESRTGEPRRS